ncbi:hypothetical protein [Arachnia propionica]|uniref:Uncharacterized protein n=1 Tax=Arachnia propionica TaxID=1750 RepID=A0A3P1WU04_9ACTN|nr:hypothetical protein [Arachnia propionica]RRD50112.1 hypothetical protein EII35_06015 [Arachnia propionica]
MDEETFRRPRAEVAPVIDQDDVPTEELPGLPIQDPTPTVPMGQGYPVHPTTPSLPEAAPPRAETVDERRRREMREYRLTFWRAWGIRALRFVFTLQLPIALVTPAAALVDRWVLPGHGIPRWATVANVVPWLAVFAVLLLGEVTARRTRWGSLLGCLARSTTIAMAGVAFAHVSTSSWIPGRIGSELALPGGITVPVDLTLARTVVLLLGWVVVLPFLLTLSRGAQIQLDGTSRFGLPGHEGLRVALVGRDPWALGHQTTPLVISQYRRRVARFYVGRVAMALWWLFALAVMAAVATA